MNTRGTAARTGEIEHQVGGLEIAVDDAAGVRVGEPGQNLVDERPQYGVRPGPRNRADLEPRQERAPRRHIHDQERRSVGQDAEVAGPDDGRVIERSEAARLLLKPPHVLGIGLGVGPVQSASARPSHRCTYLGIGRRFPCRRGRARAGPRTGRPARCRRRREGRDSGMVGRLSIAREL